MRLAFSPFCEKVAVLGRGASATVCLGVVRDDEGRPLEYVAVKSAPLPFASTMLMREKLIMDDLHGCPEVLQCIGDELVLDANNRDRPPTYNMYLEYACRGSLYKHIRSSSSSHGGGCGLPEHAVRRYTGSILRGLAHIHKRGYVHCDVKPDNILVWGDSDVKIADFGLSKKAGERIKGLGPHGIRCTPAYALPEALSRDEYEPPLDIWSLGCTVVEMITGELALKCTQDQVELPELLYNISEGILEPTIPEKLSAEGKDFLRRCFDRDPKERWTAEKLLAHPFASPGAQHPDNSNSTFSLISFLSGAHIGSKWQKGPSGCDEAIAKGPRFDCYRKWRKGSNGCDEAIAKGPRFEYSSKWRKGCNGCDEAIIKGPRFGNLIV